MSFRIKGKARYIEISGGFWGIITSEGHKYRAVNMPEQFKEENHQVDCLAELLDLDFDIFMWGKAVRIISFKTN